MITQPIPLTGRGVAESPDGGGVPLDVAGTWTIEVQATLANGNVTGVRTPFQVLNDDGSTADPADVSVPPISPTTTTLPATTASDRPDHHRLTDVAELLIDRPTARRDRRASMPDDGRRRTRSNGTGRATSSWS